MGLTALELAPFAALVGATEPVTITGTGSRGGPVPGVRAVAAPAGIVWVAPEEMTVCCGAGTPVDELQAALGEIGQYANLPSGGTVGGALAVGRSGITRLGHGPIRDGLLQARMVTAEGVVVKGGGPTVKNVSGFDLCRLVVGSHGTLAFVGEVILRTRPRPAHAQWFAGEGSDPFAVAARLHRPSAVLWDGTTTWVLLEGHPADVAAQATLLGMAGADGPPAIPDGGRESLAPGALRDLAGEFVAEIGVGVVHRPHPMPPAAVDPVVVKLHRRLKDQLDPTGRLNPGRDPLADAAGGG